jgi:hypothetical protein
MKAVRTIDVQIITWTTKECDDASDIQIGSQAVQKT